MYEMISIREDAVANALIDQRKIETILLIPHRELIGKVDCHEAFLPNGDHIYFTPSVRYYSCSERQSRNLMKSKEYVIQYAIYDPFFTLFFR